jgi:hypothetical protein
MTIDELRNSRFLRKEDVDPPVTATIDHVEKVNVAPMGEKPELKWCLFFRKEQGIKPLVLNRTNGELLARALGSRDSADWIGKDIELYADPTVPFGGKLVGGIRVRQARPAVQPIEEIF